MPVGPVSPNAGGDGGEIDPESGLAVANTHIADPNDAHDAQAISVADAGLLYAASNVEAALAEVRQAVDSGVSGALSAASAAVAAEAATRSSADATLAGEIDANTTAISEHISDANDAHDATAISIADAGGLYDAANVETALAEVMNDLNAHVGDPSAAHAASAISFGGSDVAAALAALEADTANATTMALAADSTAVSAADTALAASEAANAAIDAIAAHVNAQTAAHDASAIGFSDSEGLYQMSDVDSVLNFGLATQFAPLSAAWAVGRSYKLGQLVHHESTLYIVTADFVSGEAFSTTNLTAISAGPNSGGGTGAGAVRYVLGTADLNRNTTTPADIPGLAFSVVSGHHYKVVFKVPVRTTDATVAPGFNIASTATVSEFAIKAFGPRLGASADGWYEMAGTSFTGVLQFLDVPGTTADYIYTVEALFTASSNGTIQLQGRAEGATGTVTFQSFGYAEMVDFDDLEGDGGSSSLIPVGYKAYVYQSGGNTIAIDEFGDIILSGASGATVNRTVIQAALDYCEGTYTPGTLTTGGFGGGGTCGFGPGYFAVDDTLEVPYGVSLEGKSGFDRYGFVASAHSMQGTIIAPTSAITSMNVAASGTVTRTPVILFGRAVNSGNTQSTTNPHGARMSGIAIDCRQDTATQAVVIADTQYITLERVIIANARGTSGKAVEVISTIAPDNGAHGTHIYDCFFANCAIGVFAGGSGSTDSLIHGCRILQMTDTTISLGTTGGGGGWQISGCHFTTNGTDQTGTSEGHIRIEAGPTVVTGNYFDTTGGWAVFCATAGLVFTGNYIKMAGSRAAAIYLDDAGRKCEIIGNFCQASANTTAFVQVSGTSGDNYRPIIMGNLFGTGETIGDDANANQIVGIVIGPTGTAIAETIQTQTVGGVANVLVGNIAMLVARTGTNPFIAFNRIVQSAL